MKIYDEEVSTPREAAKAIAFSYRARMPIHLCNLLADEIENSITAFVLDERAATLKAISQQLKFGQARGTLADQVASDAVIPRKRKS